jgi:hypothetical protein
LLSDADAASPSTLPRARRAQEHDYVLYRSEAGGCCDCGDVASWQPAGCCPLHAPHAARNGAAGGAALPPAALAPAQRVLSLVFERLALAVEALGAAAAQREATGDAAAGVAESGAAATAAAAVASGASGILEAAEVEEEMVAHTLVGWLQRVCAAAALRAPAAAVLLTGAPLPTASESPDAAREALFRRTQPVGCAEQVALRAALDAAEPTNGAAGKASLLRRTPALLQRRAWPLVDRLLCVHTLHALREPLLESVTTLLLLVRAWCCRAQGLAMRLWLL